MRAPSLTLFPLALAPLYPAAALLLAAAPSVAQSISGSETVIQLARDGVSSGGSGSGVQSELEFALSSTGTGPVASSETYLLEPSVVWTEPVLGTSAPVVFSIEPSAGAASGGESRTLRGLNFTALGAGGTDVTFGGLPATGVTVLGPTELQVFTPAGVDGVGNPLAGVPVSVSNALGTSTSADDYRYLPAVYLFSPAEIGDPLAVRMSTAPNAVAVLWFGLPIDGLPPLFVPGFAGGASLLLAQTFLVNGSLLPGGELTLPLPIPENPNLVGVELTFQGASVTDFIGIGGSFTNVLSVPIQL